MGASIVTTGAAEKIVGCGATDARFLNIPALYILPLNNHTAEAKYPLQDVISGDFLLKPPTNDEFNAFLSKINKENTIFLFENESF